MIPRNRISVVIATYRRPQSLLRTLASLESQSDPADEVIVAVWKDDHGTLDAIGSERRVRVVQVDDDIMSERQNAALAAATGDVVAFIDDDAVAAPHWLRRMRLHYADSSVIGVGGRDIVRQSGHVDDRKADVVGRIRWFGRVTGNHHLRVSGTREVQFLKGCNMSFRRSAVPLLDARLVGAVPYGFEVDIGLGAARAGRILYDPQLAVDHFPSSDMSPHRPSLARTLNHNLTYVLLKHLSWPRRLAVVAYTFLIGDRDTIGLARIPLLAGRQGWTLPVFAAHFRGKLNGIASFWRWRASTGPPGGRPADIFVRGAAVSKAGQTSSRAGRTKAATSVAVVYPMLFGDQGAVGGGERYARELARALGGIVSTRLVSFADRASVDVETCADVRLRRPLTYAGGLRQNPVSVGFLADLRDVDVIHCVSWHTILTDLCVLFARITRKRVFVTDVGGGGSLSLASRAPLARAVNGFLPLSRFAAAFTPAGGSNTEIIYGGVDVGKFLPGPVQRARKVVFVGRLLPHKGVEYLVEAIPGDVLLRIVGRPYDADYFQRLQVLAVNKRVEFITDADDARVVRELQTATVATLPSVYVTRAGSFSHVPELFGLAAAEAMACGTPVITTAVASLPEVVENQATGWVVPPNDVSALAAAIRAALDDPVTAHDFGLAGRRRVEERFTWAAVAGRCLEAYATTKPSKGAP